MSIHLRKGGEIIKLLRISRSKHKVKWMFVEETLSVVRRLHLWIKLIKESLILSYTDGRERVGNGKILDFRI